MERPNDKAIVALSRNIGQTLTILTAWKGSSCVYWIAADEQFQKLWFKVYDRPHERYYAGVAATLHPKKNMWRVYLPPEYFQSGGETRYKIVCADELGMRTVKGEGVLRVHVGDVADSNDADFIVGSGAIVQDLNDDSKFYRVTCKRDEAGKLAFVLTPVDDVDKWSQDAGHSPLTFADLNGETYALDPTTGFFHALFAKYDDNGNPMLVADDFPVEGDESFAMNETTGLYHRIEKNEEGLALNNEGERK